MIVHPTPDRAVARCSHCGASVIATAPMLRTMTEAAIVRHVDARELELLESYEDSERNLLTSLARKLAS